MRGGGAISDPNTMNYKTIRIVGCIATTDNCSSMVSKRRPSTSRYWLGARPQAAQAADSEMTKHSRHPDDTVQRDEY
jgi:hypothetical protein